MLESVDCRHPGLIVYDSLGDNELNEGDLKKLLEHLNRIATGAGLSGHRNGCEPASCSRGARGCKSFWAEHSGRSYLLGDRFDYALMRYVLQAEL